MTDAFDRQLPSVVSAVTESRERYARRYVAPRPVFRLRRRHAVAMAIAGVLWLGAMQLAMWLNRAM